VAQSPSEDRLWQLLGIDQQRITALDTVTVAIKGWVVTLDSALTGIAFSSGRRSLVLVATVATVLFVILDLLYRSVQLGHAARSRALEELLVPDYEFFRFHSRASWPFFVNIARGYPTTFAFYSILLLFLGMVALSI
jgi:hypothetical protein